MNKRFANYLCILSLLMLTACLGSTNHAPVTHYGGKAGAGSIGIHNVTKGDTLYSISKRYKIAMQDIAVTNNLGAPFVLKKGQRLKLPKPGTYTVRKDDTLYSISRMFETSTSSLSRQNNLRSPYIIREGQILKLSSVQSKTQGKPSKSASAVIPDKKPRTGQTASKTKRTPPKTKISAKTPKRSSSKFLKPVQGKIISSYGPKKNGLHNDGINIQAPKGAPVRAAENGVVVYAGNELKGWGNLVLVRHSDRWMSAYSHMDRILIKRGQTVKRGQTLGAVGKTGSVDTPQLHFELRRGTEAINPDRYIDE